MANMSYCRFQNTAEDLRDCADNLFDDDDMSAEEIKARARLIRICREIATNADEYPRLEKVNKER